MLNIRVICVGRLRERFYTDAAAEYAKRLSAFCRLEICELPEERRPASPSPAATAAALSREGEAIAAKIPPGAFTAALCVEGDLLASEDVARLLERRALSGSPRLCFLIGGSDGLDEAVKKRADMRISMSRMTFPHHLARVMLLEQLYRGFQISEGGRYHK